MKKSFHYLFGAVTDHPHAEERFNKKKTGEPPAVIHILSELRNHCIHVDSFLIKIST